MGSAAADEMLCRPRRPVTSRRRGRTRPRREAGRGGGVRINETGRGQGRRRSSRFRPDKCPGESTGPLAGLPPSAPTPARAKVSPRRSRMNASTHGAGI